MNITINGHAYAVACNAGEEERLKVLGSIVNDRVSRLAEGLGQIGESKLLLMAAILLADEMTEGGDGGALLDTQAIAALESAAARVEAIAAGLDRS
jgi:cell division protein ZapA